MIELLVSLITGIVCGVVFSLMKLPLPAPPVLAGVLGIVGIFIGGWVGQKILEVLF